MGGQKKKLKGKINNNHNSSTNYQQTEGRKKTQMGKKNIITKDLSQIYPKLKLKIKYKYNHLTQSTLSRSLRQKHNFTNKATKIPKSKIHNPENPPQITLKTRSPTRSGNHRHKELKEEQAEQQTATSPPPRVARRTPRRKARQPPQARTHLTRDALSPSRSSWTPVPPIRSGMRSLSLSQMLLKLVMTDCAVVGEWVNMFICLT